MYGVDVVCLGMLLPPSVCARKVSDCSHNFIDGLILSDFIQ